MSWQLSDQGRVGRESHGRLRWSGLRSYVVRCPDLHAPMGLYCSKRLKPGRRPPREARGAPGAWAKQRGIPAAQPGFTSAAWSLLAGCRCRGWLLGLAWGWGLILMKTETRSRSIKTETPVTLAVAIARVKVSLFLQLTVVEQ